MAFVAVVLSSEEKITPVCTIHSFSPLPWYTGSCGPRGASRKIPAATATAPPRMIHCRFMRPATLPRPPRPGEPETRTRPRGVAWAGRTPSANGLQQISPAACLWLTVALNRSGQPMTDLHHFETFMRNYQDMVYATAARLLGNDADAQDMSQTVFLKAYEAFAALSASPTAGGWLKTVTTNLCLNHLTRYRARWRFFSELRSDEHDGEFLDSIPAPDSLEQNLADADHRRLIEQALRQLPAAQRVPLVLYHFENLGYDDIAAKLGVSLSKVKTDIHRARHALKRHLQPGLAGEEQWARKSAPAPQPGAVRGPCFPPAPQPKPQN